MATGAEILLALRRRVKEVAFGGKVTVSRMDVTDFKKITAGCLVEAGWDRSSAERVSVALERGDMEPLGETLGVKMLVADAPSD